VVISNGVAYTDTFVYDQQGQPLSLLHVLAGSSPARYWYVLDGHATVVALTDSAGNAVNSYTYDAWGKPLSVSETVTQPYRYASYWYDTELGWYWVQVRHYSPSLERWLQPDPSMQDGTLSYVYVGDDPIDGADPSGLCPGDGPNPNVAGGVGASEPEGSTNCQPLSRPSASPHRPASQQNDRPVILLVPGKGGRPAAYYAIIQGRVIPTDRETAKIVAHFGAPIAIAAGFAFHHRNAGGSGFNEADVVILYRSPATMAEGTKIETSGFDPKDFPGEGAWFFQLRSAAAN